MNPKKIITICLIILSVFLYFTASQIADVLFDVLKVPVTSDYAKYFPNIIAAVVAGGTFVVLMANKAMMTFLTESYVELSKVTFPTFKESAQSAVVVIAMVAFATVVLAVFDSVWSYLTKLILTS